MANKMEIDFAGVDRFIAQLNEIGGGAAERAVEGALKQTQMLVAANVSKAMSKHTQYSTGGTEKAIIRDGVVEWAQDTASISVGFDISEGGLPSIFLMYGTKVYGQPHITPDHELYNAIYSAKVKKRAAELQREAFEKVLERVMRK